MSASQMLPLIFLSVVFSLNAFVTQKLLHAVNPKLNVRNAIIKRETFNTVSLPSAQSDFDEGTYSFWNLFSNPSIQPIMKAPQDNSSNKYFKNSTSFAYRSIDRLIGDAPSFESLSNNIKLISTESKVVYLPGIDAWRMAVHPDDQDLAPPSLMPYFYNGAKLSDYHNDQVSMLFAKLARRESFLKYSDEEKNSIEEALRIAYIALWGKKTQRSLEVSIDRACGTALVLGEMENGSFADVIQAGILHDVLSESTSDYSSIREALRIRFTPKVMSLTENYIKLPKFKALKAEYTQIQSEHMIQMLVATCEEYSTLYIRLADRLHSMRNLHMLPLDNEERFKIASEAMNVYALLAHKMSLISVKNELEDLAFAYINPEMYQKCTNAQIAASIAQQDARSAVEAMISNDEYLRSNRASVRVDFRVKSKYQLFLKMSRKNLKSLNDVKDALGLRLILDTIRRPGESIEELELREQSLCYYIVNKLKDLPGWKSEGTKDYISEKKDTGYRSLHHFLVHKVLNTPVEIQVRTIAMHHQAEVGEAAHWFYKDLLYRPEIVQSKFYSIAWRSPKQMQASSAAELIRLAKEQLKSRVYVFMNDHATVLNLKSESTCLDAAFNVHSKLGLTTSFVKVNGRPVELNTPLHNCDVINVEGSIDNSIKATQDWLNSVKTRVAKKAIENHFKCHERSELAAEGCVLLMMCITKNSNQIISKYHGIPDARDLSKMVRSHTSFSDISQLLVQLGRMSHHSDGRNEVLSIMSDLLGLPPDRLRISTPHASFKWAKMQSVTGWADKNIRNLILFPMLRELLPSLGLVFVEQKWCKLVGSNSLLEDPYRDLASTHFRSRRGGIDTTGYLTTGPASIGTTNSYEEVPLLPFSISQNSNEGKARPLQAV